MRRRTTNLGFLGIALTLVAMVAAPVQADDVVYSGIDVWTTSPFGTSALDFSDDPLPVDFFCSGSELFDGVVPLVGSPVATEPHGALGSTDTIVHRLDDAVFDESGVARTRIQVRALSMVSLQPIRTRCGAFDVRVALDGEQPITVMEIRREQAEGGTFRAPLELRAKLLFTPVDQPEARPLEFLQDVTLEPAPGSQWSFRKPELRRAMGFIVADTDGDRQPDRFLPGDSNFAANRAVGAAATTETTVLCQAETFSTLTQADSLAGTTVTSGPSIGTTSSRCCIETCHCTKGATDPLTPCADCEEGHLHCNIVQVPCDFEPNECATGPFCCPTSTSTSN